MASESTATKVGHGLAKALGIKLHYRDPTNQEAVLSRGESVFSVSSADQYIEKEPTVAEWFRDIIPSGPQFLHYLYSLFPFTHWIGRYNVQWLFGDLVAGMNLRFPTGTWNVWLTRHIGITVGCVVVPQSMAYASLANLPVEYGLYSSFMGVLVYWFFATSKDITIGVSCIDTRHIDLARANHRSLLLSSQP